MRRYQRKLLEDGAPNPQWRPDRRKRKSGKSGRSSSSGPSGTKRAKFDRGLFTAWDGEGATIRGRHEYILLASSSGVELVHPRGLSSVDTLVALAEGMAADPHAVHVGFAVSYDVNMMLRDFPKASCRELWGGERTVWYHQGHYLDVTYRPRKFLRVRTATRVSGPWVGGTLWDVWPFFQSSFVAACAKYKIGSSAERAVLEDGKAARATFRAKDLKTIVPYTRVELKLLVELMTALWRSLQSANLRVSRWDGPGAVAAALLTREGVKDRPPASASEATLDAFQYAYYGGRVECVRYGRHAGMVHQYDVNSAYPAAMQHVPCHAAGCGRWEHMGANWFKSGGTWDTNFTLHRVQWDFPQTAAVYPFPWRSARGGVYFPRQGEGWVWEPELRAAREREDGLERSYHIRESWRWVQTCDHPGPYAWIPRIYAERERARALGDGAEHALKLSLNSLYGKCAQRAGAQLTRDGWRLPPFHDLAAAGWVTSCVRAELFRVAVQNPDTTIMLATDALYTTAPAVGVTYDRPGEKTLGGWTYAQHAAMTVVQSGVYWLEATDGARTLYSRGFDRASLNHANVLRAWRAGRPSVHAFQRRFVGLGLALAGVEGTQASQRAWARWRRWVEDPRELSLHPWTTKRTPVVDRSRRPSDPSRGLITTTPADTSRLWVDDVGLRGRMTTPSPVPWRALPGAPVEEEADVLAKADAESEDARL